MAHEVYERLNNLSMDELIKVMSVLKDNKVDCSLRTVTVNNDTAHVKFMLVVDDVNLLIDTLDSLEL
jgi:hypothetical protein|nr:MAG TPA: hypothetical protein [Caudoviricetes sp.]